MAKPSLAASLAGIQLAKQAMIKAGWTQKHLSDLVGCSRQPITNFLKGDAIAQPIFMQICAQLELDWQAIADLKPMGSEPDDLDAIVQDLRAKVCDSIQEYCGTMRVLDMSYPIGVEDIYTNVNVLEQITGRRRKKLDELLQEYEVEEFDRLGLGKVTEERISGITAVQKYQKLIILGKPGAGKTTFLKYLAIQCNRGHFEVDRVPIFVTLKDFADAVDQPSLIQYICQQHLDYLVSSIEPEEKYIDAFYRVFSQGRSLILLDGLDEVRRNDHDRVLQEIRDFSEQFRNNHFVITCRIAAWEYTFEKFTEVEVADFDEAQIQTFAIKWFRDKPIYPTAFLRSLKQSDRIHQLAVSPLLLTLLCLAFEESGEFPSSRAELYKEGIDALLKKWDGKRGIQRDQVYRNLSHQRKQDLLSQIAFETFDRHEYFLKQRILEQMIVDYITQLPAANIEPEALQLDSEAILRSLEAQHGLLVERAKGIYSFSHLTFHEYFAAREMILNHHSLQDLLVHLYDQRWREIFLLIAEMLRDASQLLVPMKQAIDQLLAPEKKLQEFLKDVCDRASSPEFLFCKPAAVRAFFFDIDFDLDKNRTVALFLDPAANILVCASFLTRILENTELEDGIAIAQKFDTKTTDSNEKITAAKSADEAMSIAIKIAHNSKKLKPEIRKKLDAFLERLEDQQTDEEELEQVADNARSIAKARHQIGNTRWKFDDREKVLLCQYYEANKLLLHCLAECAMNPKTRQQVESELLLPFGSIEEQK